MTKVLRGYNKPHIDLWQGRYWAQFIKAGDNHMGIWDNDLDLRKLQARVKEKWDAIQGSRAAEASDGGVPHSVATEGGEAVQGTASGEDGATDWAAGEVAGLCGVPPKEGS